MFVSQLIPSSMHLPALPLAGFWFGDAASTDAQYVDDLFNLINYISFAFFALIIGMMIVFLLKYQNRKGHKEQYSPSHSTLLEVSWSVIPTLLLALLFFLGFKGYVDMRTPPDNAYDVQVLASKWKFLFRYPNGAESEELHVPPDQPIRLVQQSADVLHSLYIPAFRTKMDCVPGRYTYQWFESEKPGTYDLFCAEYCGKDHSNMNSIVVVHESQAAFEAKLDELNTPPSDPVEWGELLYNRKGCVQCHTTDGSARPGGGPSFDKTYGNTHQLEGGGTVVGNENYIKESIRQPQAKIRAGYKGVTMTTFPPSLVKDAEVDALIAFIKSVNPDYVPPPETEEETPETEGEESAESEEMESEETESEETESEETEEPKEETP